MTKLFSRSRTPTRPILSAVDLDKLLEAISRAALLVDKHDQQIISVNPKVMELTAYTREELDTMKLSEIMRGDLDVLLSMRNNDTEATRPRTEILARNQREIYVSVKAEPFGDQNPWVLLTFEEVKIRKIKRKKIAILDELVDQTFIDLLSTVQEHNPEEAISEILDIGNHLLPSSSMAIYIGKGDSPSVRLVQETGPNFDIFPTELSPPDLNHLLEASIWHKGQRSIVTLLHQSARMAGLSYLASAPISNPDESNAWLGLIVSCGQETPPDNTLALLRILATTTAVIIQKNLVIGNLRKSIATCNKQLNVFDTIQKHTIDGAITVLPDLTIESINPAAEIILGYALNEIKGLPIENIIIGTDRFSSALRDALLGISHPSLGNLHLHRRDGASFPAELSVNPIIGQGVTEILIMIRDLSEHEQIRTHTHQLEQRALLGEVTAVFAHEVRNPINNLSTGLQILSHNLDTDDPEQKRIQMMQEDCARLTALMDSVLTFSRTGNYQFKPLDVSILLRKILKRWRPRFSRVNIKDNYQSADNLPYVFGDQRSLEQVFTNIISNAVDAMQESGGAFSVKLSEVVANGGKSVVQIDLSDTGPGVPEHIQERIFDPFFTTSPNGTGLGLSITKQIITAHKGCINLTSFPGGTAFHIQLPTAPKMKDPIQ